MSVRSERRRAEREQRFDRAEDQAPPPLPGRLPHIGLEPEPTMRRRLLPAGSRHLGDDLYETPDGRMYSVTD